MWDRIETLLPKLRYVVAAMLVIGNLFLLSLLVSSTATAQNPATPAEPQSASMYDGPNALTGGLVTSVDAIDRAMQNFSRALSSTGNAIARGFQSFGTAILQGGKLVVRGMSTSAAFVGRGVVSGATLAARGVGNGFMLMARGVGNSIGFMFHTTGSILGFIADTPPVSAVIKPASNIDAPVIDAPTSTFAAARTPLPVAAPAAQPAVHSDHGAAWPLRGEITTLFGVPHWPWQPTHTGIDISTSRPSGVSQIKPYKPGRVVETVRSYSGLGNYVVVDHGGGVTSVYGHLYSIAVSAGQTVDMNTALGTEGSTGASTGTHLHFEIRINGQPVNPLQYVNGRP